MTDSLRLYVWLENVEAIADYGQGTCFALAESWIDAAYQVSLDYAGGLAGGEPLMEFFWRMFSELYETEPVVCDGPCAFFVYGSA